jgi:hypothetical protein
LRLKPLQADQPCIAYARINAPADKPHLIIAAITALEKYRTILRVDRCSHIIAIRYLRGD